LIEVAAQPGAERALESERRPDVLFQQLVIGGDGFWADAGYLAVAFALVAIWRALPEFTRIDRKRGRDVG
jgi:hypothetical protein